MLIEPESSCNINELVSCSQSEFCNLVRLVRSGTGYKPVPAFGIEA